MVDCFEMLEQKLAARGLADAAEQLQQTRTAVYTTSSELYGEIGLTIRQIYQSLSGEAAASLKTEFRQCETTVRQVWPGFRLKP